MKKNHIIKSYLSFLFILMGFFYLVTFNSCDILEDDPPVTTTELGDTLWIHDRISGTYYMGSSLALGQDGSIYYSFSGGQITWEPVRIAAVDKTDGSLKWMTEDLDHIGLSSDIVVGDDGTIYAIGYHILYAINPATGAFKWTWEVPQTLPLPDGGEINSYGQIGALALLGNGNLVLGSVGSGVYSRAMYCISTTGTMVWYNRDAVGWGLGTGLTVGANNKIFYYENNHLKALDGVSGQLLWTKKIAGIGSAANNIAIHDNGELICCFIKEGDTKYYLYRIDSGNGAILWQSVDESSSAGLLLSPNGQVTQLLGNLHLIDLTTGKARKFTAENVGLAVAINSNNQYLIPRGDGCSTYDEDGTLDWHMKMSNLKGQILIGDNKVIYGIKSDGQIYAIQGDSKLATSGWPKKSHDNRNTFNSSKH